MLRNAQSEMTTAPWIAIFPGLMIFIVVMAMNTSAMDTSGDGLRDVHDSGHFKGRS
jgi:peptide/nickel transport system permease protein